MRLISVKLGNRKYKEEGIGDCAWGFILYHFGFIQLDWNVSAINSTHITTYTQAERFRHLLCILLPDNCENRMHCKLDNWWYVYSVLEKVFLY